LPANDFILKAETAAKKALELDATLAEPHAALGMIRSQYQWDWKDADKEFRRAIELDPNYPTAHDWYSVSLQFQSKLEEALSEGKRAQELDPLSPVICNNLGVVLDYMERYDLAREEFNKAFELDPTFALAHESLGLLYAQQGKFDEAVGEMKNFKRMVGENDPWYLGDLGYIYAKAGRKDEATNMLNQLLELSKQGYTVSAQLAGIYAGLGNKDKAFEWIEKGYDEQDYWIGSLKVGPEWNNLRSDPRYTVMLKKIGLDK
jgi:Flp pilus assembly protein TadD